jgi:hypothetical protein
MPHYEPRGSFAVADGAVIPTKRYLFVCLRGAVAEAYQFDWSHEIVPMNRMPVTVKGTCGVDAKELESLRLERSEPGIEVPTLRGPSPYSSSWMSRTAVPRLFR